MSAEENAALVRRYFGDCVGRIRLDSRLALALVDELMTDDFTMFYNNETCAEASRGRERHKAFLTAHLRNFPMDEWTVEALVAEDDVVACWWRIRARHAATGNPVDVRAADFFRVRAGRLAELRRFLDFKSLDQQLSPTAARR